MLCTAEDEEPGDEDDEDDEPINPLVDALFDEIENLRIRVSNSTPMEVLQDTKFNHQLFESEMHCAIIEAETREEVIQEMEKRMQQMENMYTRRLMKQVRNSFVGRSVSGSSLLVSRSNKMSSRWMPRSTCFIEQGPLERPLLFLLLHNPRNWRISTRRKPRSSVTS